MEVIFFHILYVNGGKSSMNENFQKLIVIANPNIDTMFDKYDEKSLLLIISFTRIFNIKQFLYLIESFSLDITNVEKIVTYMKRIKKKYEEEFVRNYGNPSPNSMDTCMLVEDELKSNLFNTDGLPLPKALHIIALESFKIEAEFQRRRVEFIKVVSWKKFWFRKGKYSEFEKKSEAMQRRMGKFVSDYSNYIENNEFKDANPIDFYGFFEPKESGKINTGTVATKNTISFMQYIENKKTSAAKTFRILFAEYDKTAHTSCANIHALSGHVYYFRLLVIIKMIALVELYGTNDMYYGIPIREVLFKKVEAVKESAPELLSIDQEEITRHLLRDGMLLMGCQNILANRADIDFLFCLYLELEKTWLQYEKHKMKCISHTPYEKYLCRRMNNDADIVKGFYNEFSSEIGFKERINKMDGKIIEFPR